PIPAAGDDDTAFLGSERGHDRIAGVVAPGELGGLLNGGHEGIEEAGLSRSLGGKPAVFEKPRDRRISFLAGDAVDRIGVVTGGDQQARSVCKGAIAVKSTSRWPLRATQERAPAMTKLPSATHRSACAACAGGEEP